MNVEAVMTRDPLTVSADATLDAAMELMSARSLRHLPVVRDGKLVGIVSNRDLLEATGWGLSNARPIDAAERAAGTVDQVMTSPVSSVRPQDTVVTASLELVLQKIGSLPVVEDGSLLGILTERDLLKAWLGLCEGDNDPGERHTPVRVVTTRNLLTLSTRSTFGDAIAMCRDERINHLPVAEQGKLIGFLSDRDLKTALGQGMSQDAPITELYKREVYTLTEDATLYEAARLMDERVISGVPIVAKGTDRDLVGLVTLSDVLGHCMESLREPDQPAR